MKKIIILLLIIPTLTQGLARLIDQQRSVDGKFLPKETRLAIIGDTYDRIRNPLWHLFLLFRARNVGITTDTTPVETDSNRLICVGQTCPDSDEQAQQRLRTSAFRRNLELMKQREAKAEQLVDQQEMPKGKFFGCFRPFHYKC